MSLPKTPQWQTTTETFLWRPSAPSQRFSSGETRMTALCLSKYQSMSACKTPYLLLILGRCDSCLGFKVMHLHCFPNRLVLKYVVVVFSVTWYSCSVAVWGSKEAHSTPQQQCINIKLLREMRYIQMFWCQEWKVHLLVFGVFFSFVIQHESPWVSPVTYSR